MSSAESHRQNGSKKERMHALCYPILASITHEKMIKKVVQKNNRFKLSRPTWDEELELPVGYYSVSIFKTILSILSKSMRC